MQADDDSQYVRCLKCLKILKCSRYDTTCLLDHIKSDHPEIDLCGQGDGGRKMSSTKNSNDAASVSSLNDGMSNKKVESLRSLAEQYGISHEKISQISKATGLSEEQLAERAERYLSSGRSSNTSSKRNAAKMVNADSNDLQKRKMYRKSIERWIPTDGSIYCPKCSCCRPPVLKTRAEAYPGNCCACCMLSCWPFCFLPCLIPQDNREYMHCSNCCNFLGLYDRENNCIKPNRQYTACPNRCQGGADNESKKSA